MYDDTLKYKWSHGARVKSSVSADDAARVLNGIHERDGVVKPQAVVDEAKPSNSPIHDAFEWRDKVAANEHRKWQARNMVRALVVSDESRADKPTVESVRVFVSASNGTKDKPSGYYTGAKLLDNKDLFDRAYDDAIKKLRIAEQSVSELKRLADDSKERDVLKALMIATEALSTATTAIRQTRH